MGKHARPVIEDFRKFQRICSLLDTNHEQQKKPQDRFQECQTALVKPHPSSRHRRPTLLIDENMTGSVSYFRSHGFPTLSVKLSYAGRPDSEIFDWAVRRNLVIITRDHGFASFTNYNHSRALGAAIFFDPHECPIRALCLNAALTHFVTDMSRYIPLNRGLVITYAYPDKSFQAYLPDRANPHRPVEVAHGNYMPQYRHEQNRLSA